MKISKILPLGATVVLLSMDPLSAGSADTSAFRIAGKSQFESVVGETRQPMYLLNDASILSDAGSVASIVDAQNAGTIVYVLEMSGSSCKVLTASGKIGYIALNKLTDRCEYVFKDADTTKYASEGTVIRSLPFDSGTKVTTLSENDEIHITGTNSFVYQECEVDGRICYVSCEDLMDEKIVYPDPVAEVVEVSAPAVNAAPPSYTWNGQRLNPVLGTVMGPNGKETYYNLPMGGVVNIMRSMGYNGEYWVRSDGVKMLGDYIMVACDLSIRPRGSLIETSLGTAMVCDTGTFIYSNPYQIDIAVAW